MVRGQQMRLRQSIDKHKSDIFLDEKLRRILQCIYIYMIKWRALLTRLVRFWWEYSSSSWFMFILYFQAYKMTSGSDRRQSVQSYKDYACRKTVHIKQLMFQQSSQIHRYICNHFGFLVFSVFPASIKFCVLVFERIITEYNYIIKWIIIKKNKSITISTAYDFLSTLKMRKSWWWSNENQPKFTATINIKSSPFLYNLKVLFLLFVKINLGQPIICSFFCCLRCLLLACVSVKNDQTQNDQINGQPHQHRISIPLRLMNVNDAVKYLHSTTHSARTC